MKSARKKREKARNHLMRKDAYLKIAANHISPTGPWDSTPGVSQSQSARPRCFDFPISRLFPRLVPFLLLNSSVGDACFYRLSIAYGLFGALVVVASQHRQATSRFLSSSSFRPYPKSQRPRQSPTATSIRPETQAAQSAVSRLENRHYPHH